MLIGNTYSLQCLKHSRYVLTGVTKIVSEINEMAKNKKEDILC